MFEAIHGSAPPLAGKNIANPSGLLQGAVMMLNHISQTAIAQKIQNAWLATLEEGIHTADIYKGGFSKKQVGTKEFADAVISNLGKTPKLFQAVSYAGAGALQLPSYKRKMPAVKKLVGVDLFVHWTGSDPNELAQKIKTIETKEASLSMITNRGIKVWPDGFSETFCTDHWRCRFKASAYDELTKETIVSLLTNAIGASIDTIKTENLYEFDGIPRFSVGQGQ
jgi:isocitrate dehydrogenase